jgi:hypothetical protein
MRCVHIGFGHAVTFEHGVSGARLPFAMSVREQWRRARNEQPLMLGGFAVERGLAQQRRVEGRPHKHGGACHQLDDQVGIKCRQKDHRGASEQRDVAGHEQAVGMIDRQRVDQHVLVGKAPVIDQAERVGREIVMRQHRTLGAASGAGRIEDGGEIVVGARNDCELRARLGRGLGERSLAIRSERHDLGADFGCNRRDALRLGRVTHHYRGLGIGHEVFELVQRVGGVERQIYRAGVHGRQIKHETRDRFLGLCGDAVARLDSVQHEQIRDLPGAGDHHRN